MKGTIHITKKRVPGDLKETHSLVVLQAGGLREVYLEPDWFLKNHGNDLHAMVEDFERRRLGRVVARWWLVRNIQHPDLDPFLLWHIPPRPSPPLRRGSWVTKPNHAATEAYKRLRHSLQTLLYLRGVELDPDATDSMMLEHLYRLLGFRTKAKDASTS